MLFDKLIFLLLPVLGLFTYPVSVTLKLVNPSGKRIAFMMLARAPNNAYSANPNVGIVKPHDAITVIRKWIKLSLIITFVRLLKLTNRTLQTLQVSRLWHRDRAKLDTFSINVWRYSQKHQIAFLGHLMGAPGASAL